ncbi:multidrug MFS transporter [bacterium]|nr:multidrug MFS transporter [candidate division CSSED10-310 bacterium]
MMFVTVGTHEASFERLLKTVDILRERRDIKDPVFIQTGHTAYTPVHCGYRMFLPFSVMNSLFQRARVVVTHGGDCVMLVLKHGKVPIVVPRLKRYGEHLDDHQLEFTRHMSELGLVMPCIEMEDLPDALRRWERGFAGGVAGMVRENARRFAELMEQMSGTLVGCPGILQGTVDNTPLERG